MLKALNNDLTSFVKFLNIYYYVGISTGSDTPPHRSAPQGGLCARSLKGKGKYTSVETQDGTVATWTNFSRHEVDFYPCHVRCAVPPVDGLAVALVLAPGARVMCAPATTISPDSSFWVDIFKALPSSFSEIRRSTHCMSLVSLLIAIPVRSVLPPLASPAKLKRLLFLLVPPSLRIGGRRTFCCRFLKLSYKVHQHLGDH